MTEEKRSTGLTYAEVKALQNRYGKNELEANKRESFVRKVFHILCEPMFLLLILAAVIYFILGAPGDGAVMLIFVAGIISIDVIQEWKTDRTLNKLKDLSAPRITVIREGREQVIASAELVPGDLMMICEGVKIPADGFIVSCHDLCVDESSLTGESESVRKVSKKGALQSDEYWRKDYCYAGTLVICGNALVSVEKTGARTEYGKIGVHVVSAAENPTPLQKQTAGLVRLCAVIAVLLFMLVSVFTYINLSEYTMRNRLIESILSGVTLAMAMIPEEFPVVLTVFLSMGAWRLAKKNALVRRLPSVETLGAVSVLCVDKTGTVTTNQMTVQRLWTLNGDETRLTKAMGLACETEAYDPMEKAMLAYCKTKGISEEEIFSGQLISEYTFTDELKMMGHVWLRNGKYIAAAKGSPEQIATVCEMTEAELALAEQITTEMSSEGLRVIAVAGMTFRSSQEIPACITDCRFTFLGLAGLADPPRAHIRQDIERCRQAGIRVVMITGDHGMTAASIAKKAGMCGCDHILTGRMLDKMDDEELRKQVQNVCVFARVVPEHKMRIVRALRENGEIVAMTGDGVNDAPAMKYADIGIAMGRRGSEVSREAADLILTDDHFTTVVETVQDGRRIYDNIRKAVGYIFTIHIPIALSSLLAPFLGITPPSLMLLPLHVVLLELLIDPTCSIVLERQPAETDIMARKPRKPNEKLLNVRLLTKSIFQGIVMFAASFGTYLFMLKGNPENAPAARSMGLVIMMLANLFLVLVNSSEHDYAYRSVTRLAGDKVMWFALCGTALMLIAVLYTPLNGFLKLAALSCGQLLTASVVAVISVFWYEIVKFIKTFNRK